MNPIRELFIEKSTLELVRNIGLNNGQTSPIEPMIYDVVLFNNNKIKGQWLIVDIVYKPDGFKPVVEPNKNEDYHIILKSISGEYIKVNLADFKQGLRDNEVFIIDMVSMV